MANSVLLFGGIVLVHDNQNRVQPVRADVLIEGSTIVKIEQINNVEPHTRIVDCRGKIVSPGFIDTHHHVWQTLIKGRAEQTLLDSPVPGDLMASSYVPSDIFWAQLGGCLECLDVGTTTVVDHAQVNHSPEHSSAAIAATVATGIRSVFCHCPTLRIGSWTPIALNPTVIRDWILQCLEELTEKPNLGPSARVRLGLEFDAMFLPQETVVSLSKRAKKMGVKIITLHYIRSPVSGNHSLVSLLHTYNILDSSTQSSPATNTTNASKEDTGTKREADSGIAYMPNSNFQTFGTTPVAFHPQPNDKDHCSLGVDCHSHNSSYMVSEMRALLRSARATHTEISTSPSENTPTIDITTEGVFNLGTLAAARAIGMEQEIGSLAVGKKADILIFNAQSPALVEVAQHDPVAAIVLHSSPIDVETVMVDGIFRKENGQLQNTNLVEGERVWSGVSELKGETWWRKWPTIEAEILGRRSRIQEEIEQFDTRGKGKQIDKGWHIDEKMVEKKVLVGYTMAR